MWKVYILYSESYQRSYVGVSANTEERLSYHNSGKVTSTKIFKPWKIIFEENVESYSVARKREKYYKSGVGRKKLKSIFDDLGLNKSSA